MGGERDKWEAQTASDLGRGQEAQNPAGLLRVPGPRDAVSLIRAMSIALRPRHQERFLGSAQGWDEVISARRQGGKEGRKKRGGKEGRGEGKKGEKKRKEGRGGMKRLDFQPCVLYDSRHITYSL